MGGGACIGAALGAARGLGQQSKGLLPRALAEQPPRAWNAATQTSGAAQVGWSMQLKHGSGRLRAAAWPASSTASSAAVAATLGLAAHGMRRFETAPVFQKLCKACRRGTGCVSCPSVEPGCRRQRIAGDRSKHNTSVNSPASASRVSCGACALLEVKACRGA